MRGVTWEQSKQQHGSPDKSSEVTPQPNRDPDIVPKLKTLRSRLPRRRQEAAFVAFAFEPRGRGSSTQGVLQLKNLPLGPSAAAAFSCRSGITLHAEAPPSCRPDDETTTGHDTH